MKISIVTLFAEMFAGPFDYSILKKIQEKQLLSIEYINIRDFGIGKHKIVDDKPYGGGVGMILRVDVLKKAIDHAKCQSKPECRERIILTDARGHIYNQKKTKELSMYDHLIFIAGHYEGFDERVLDLVDETISIGEYILTCGEIPIMVLVDSVSRLIPNGLKPEATIQETLTEEGTAEQPQYTKPRMWRKRKVPEVLLWGNHKKIAEWKKSKSVKKQNSKPQQ